MDRFAVDGHTILCWPAAVPSDVCVEIARFLPWPTQQRSSQLIREDQAQANALGGRLLPFMLGAPSLRWLPSVTLTKAYKVPYHVDQKKGADWKVCLYLDDVEQGGTVFRSKDFKTELRPPSEQGTIVMFDIVLEHRTDDYDISKMRRVLGLRAAFQPYAFG